MFTQKRDRGIEHTKQQQQTQTNVLNFGPQLARGREMRAPFPCWQPFDSVLPMECPNRGNSPGCGHAAAGAAHKSTSFGHRLPLGEYEISPPLLLLAVR